MAPSSLSWDPCACSCPWEPHCSSQGLSHAALQVICAQSYSPSPVSFTEFSGLIKREWSHILSWFVWYWKAFSESWLSAFQFSSLLFIHLQTHFHFSNFVTKEDGKFTPRWGHLAQWISKAVYHCLTVTVTGCCVTGWVVHLSLWWMVQQPPKLPLTFFLSYYPLLAGHNSFSENTTSTANTSAIPQIFLTREPSCPTNVTETRDKNTD